MSFTSAIPYVFQRGNLYCFRWTFSRLLAQVFGRRELRRSLKTGYKAVALRRAMELAAKLRSLTHDFDSMREITPQNLHILLNQYFLDAIGEREDWRARAASLQPTDVENELTAFRFLQRDNQERLRLHNYHGLRPVVEMLAADWGVAAPAEDSETYRQLCRGLLRTDAQIFDIELRRTAGDYADAGYAHNAPASGLATSVRSLRLSEAIKQFTAEMESAEQWGDRTKIDNAAIFRDLIEIVGDVALCAVTRDALLNYRGSILRLPPRRLNDPRYKELYPSSNAFVKTVSSTNCSLNTGTMI